MALIILSVALALPVSAKPKTAVPRAAGIVSFHKKVDPGALQKQLIDAGFAVSFIECSRDDCRIHLKPGETKNPTPIVDRYVYVDPFEARRNRMAAMRALSAKWKDSAITPEEKDQLLRMLVQHVLGE